MDNWYSYTLYPAAPPKPFLYSRSELPTEPSLHRRPGSQKSSGSSDTGTSPKTEKSRRFLFTGRRKKHQNLPEISFDSIADGLRDISPEKAFKAIAYSSCAKEQSAHTIDKPYNFSRPIDPRNSQLREWELNPRRHSDSSYQSSHTFTQEQFRTPAEPQEELHIPTPSEKQYDSHKSLQKSSFLHTSSEVIANCAEPPPVYNWLGEAPKSSSFLTERAWSPLRDRLSLTPRPLSSGSNTLGEVEPSVPIRLEKKFPSRLRVNPFRTKHTRSRSDQSEAFGSWEEAVDWWYEYGEDEAIDQHAGYI